MNPRQFSWLFACVLAMVSPLCAAQGNYPSKPVRLVVPWPAGGPVDITGRIIGQKLAANLGQQFFIDNKPGADGSIGSAYVAKAAPDGYTLLLASTTTHSINPVISATNLTFDPVKDFAPVILVDTRPYILLVNAVVPAKSVKELVALAKAKKGELANATAGASNKAAGEDFAAAGGVEILHVPYQGAAPAMNALLGGQVSMFFAPGPLAVPQIKAGKVRGIAITSKARSPLLPDLPTMSESGLPGFEFSTWEGVVVPTGTPAAVITKLNGDLSAVLKAPDVQAKFAEIGAAAEGGSPQDMAAYMKADALKWARALKK